MWQAKAACTLPSPRRSRSFGGQRAGGASTRGWAWTGSRAPSPWELASRFTTPRSTGYGASPTSTLTRTTGHDVKLLVIDTCWNYLWLFKNIPLNDKESPPPHSIKHTRTCTSKFVSLYGISLKFIWLLRSLICFFFGPVHLFIFLPVFIETIFSQFLFTVVLSCSVNLFLSTYINFPPL